MTPRDVMQQALDAIGSAYREHFVHTHGSTRNELQGAANAIRAELAKPAAVPDGLPSDGTLPQHYVDGWNAARFAALGHPPALAVDVEAVRGTIFRMKDNHKLRESRCKPDPLISIWANELARAIGDAK